LTTNCHL